MTLTPKPSAPAPETEIYERRESGVRSYSRSMPRQFDRAEDVWLHDVNGGRYLDFLSGCSSLNYGHNHPQWVGQAPKPKGEGYQVVAL